MGNKAGIDPVQEVVSLAPEGGDLLAPLAGPFRRAVRLHPHRGTPAAWPGQGSIPWQPQGYFHAPTVDPSRRLAYHTGALYPQSAASQVPVLLLAPEPGAVVVDACAAPGSKTTQIAQAVGPHGLVMASDIAAPRRRVLAEVLARQGAINALVTPMALARLAAKLPGVADAVLVDAPCSGHEQRNAKQVAQMARRQLKILAQTVPLLRPGGVLVYSTCTPYIAENEGVVTAFCRQFPEFIIEPQTLPGCDADLAGLGGVRLYPHRQGTEPFFAIRLRRQGSQVAAALNGDLPPAPQEAIPTPWLALPWRWVIKGDRLLAMSEAAAQTPIPGESRGLLVARRRGDPRPDGAHWQPTPWGAQALLAAGVAPVQVVTASVAAAAYAGEVVLAADDGLVAVDDGQPLGLAHAGRLHLPAAAYRQVVADNCC